MTFCVGLRLFCSLLISLIRRQCTYLPVLQNHALLQENMQEGFFVRTRNVPLSRSLSVFRCIFLYALAVARMKCSFSSSLITIFVELKAGVQQSRPSLPDFPGEGVADCSRKCSLIDDGVWELLDRPVFVDKLGDCSFSCCTYIPSAGISTLIVWLSKQKITTLCNTKQPSINWHYNVLKFVSWAWTNINDYRYYLWSCFTDFTIGSLQPTVGEMFLYINISLIHNYVTKHY